MSDEQTLDVDEQLDQELEGVFADEAPEAVEEAAPATPPEAVDGHAESPAEATEQVAEGEAPEGTPEPEAEQEAEDDLADLRDADGNFSAEAIAKERKARREAQKLIGKTAKDREEINALRQRAQQADIWDQVAREEPELQAAIQRVVRRRRGEEVPPEPRPEAVQPTINKDELNTKLRELYAKGDFIAAAKLYNEHDPDVQEAKRAREELRRFKEEQRAEAERVRAQEKVDAEVRSFKAKYAGSLFEKDGSVKDAELYDKLVTTLKESGHQISFERALIIAETELGRNKAVPAKAPVDPAKRQAMRLPQGTKPVVKPKPAPKRPEDFSTEDLQRELEASI